MSSSSESDFLVRAFRSITDSRISVRDFTNRRVSSETIEDAMSIAHHAPSAGNLHASRGWIVRDASVRAAIGRAANQDFVGKAPIIIVAAADALISAQKYGQRGSTLYSIQDATIWLSHLQLALTAFGLSSCWVGAFDEIAVAKSIASSSRVRPVALLVVGYGDSVAVSLARRQRIYAHALPPSIHIEEI